MSATESTVNRTDDPATGDDFATFDKASGAKTQSMNLDQEVAAKQLTRVSTAGTAAEVALISALARGFFQADCVLDAAVTGNRWLMIFDKATTPVNTDVPVLRARFGAGWASIDLGVYGLELTNGLGIAISTTPNVLTLPGAGEGYFQVGYA